MERPLRSVDLSFEHLCLTEQILLETRQPRFFSYVWYSYLHSTVQVTSSFPHILNIHRHRLKHVHWQISNVLFRQKIYILHWWGCNDDLILTKEIHLLGYICMWWRWCEYVYISHFFIYVLQFNCFVRTTPWDLSSYVFYGVRNIEFEYIREMMMIMMTYGTPNHIWWWSVIS